MIPAAFDFVRADSADAALAALAEHGDEAKLMAGGVAPVTACDSAIARALTDDPEMVAAVRELSASLF